MFCRLVRNLAFVAAPLNTKLFKDDQKTFALLIDDGIIVLEILIEKLADPLALTHLVRKTNML